MYDAFLSVEENTLKERITLFPNPATDTVTLTVAPSVVLSGVEIFDVQGKLLYAQNKLETNSLQQNIKVSSYKSGVYFIKVKSTQGEVTLRFVKR